jgi:hypothetical protein
VTHKVGRRKVPRRQPFADQSASRGQPGATPDQDQKPFRHAGRSRVFARDSEGLGLTSPRWIQRRGRNSSMACPWSKWLKPASADPAGCPTHSGREQNQSKRYAPRKIRRALRHPPAIAQSDAASGRTPQAFFDGRARVGLRTFSDDDIEYTKINHFMTRHTRN